MQEYETSNLRFDKEKKEWYFTVPRRIYELAGFSAAAKVWRLLRWEDNTRWFDMKDRFYLYLAPFRGSVLDSLFSVEVELVTEAATLAHIVSFLASMNVNILRCKSVDRGKEEGGKLLMICTGGRALERPVPGENVTSVGNVSPETPQENASPAEPNNTDDVANDAFRANLTIFLKSLTQPLELDKVVRGLHIRTLKSSPRLKGEGREVGRGYVFIDSSERPIEQVSEAAALPENHETVRIVVVNQRLDSQDLDRLTDVDIGNFISISYDSQSGILQATSRNPLEENVACLLRLRNLPGTLRAGLLPLGDARVDLRLVQAERSSLEGDEANPVAVESYRVIGNVRDTKFSLIAAKSMTRAFNAEIVRWLVSRREEIPDDELVLEADRLPSILTNDGAGLVIEECKCESFVRPTGEEVGSGKQSFVRFGDTGTDSLSTYGFLFMPDSEPTLSLRFRYNFSTVQLPGDFSFSMTRDELILCGSEAATQAAHFFSNAIGRKSVAARGRLLEHMFVASLSDAVFAVYIIKRLAVVVDSLVDRKLRHFLGDAPGNPRLRDKYRALLSFLVVSLDGFIRAGRRACMSWASPNGRGPGRLAFSVPSDVEEISETISDISAAFEKLGVGYGDANEVATQARKLLILFSPSGSLKDVQESQGVGDG